MQHDLVVAEVQAGEIVAGFAGLPENWIEGGPINALFSSILSGRLKSFKRNISWEFSFLPLSFYSLEEFLVLMVMHFGKLWF